MNITSKPEDFHAADAYRTRLPGEERLTPRRDPVLWSDWTGDAPITRQEAAHYEEKGYLIRRNLFSDAELRLLIDTSLRLRGAGGPGAPADFVTEPGTDAVRTVFRLDTHSPVFARLAADKRLAGVARFLLGDEVCLHQSRLNYKPGFTGKEFYWHSDFETWHAEDGMPRMRAVSASVLLTDNSPLNGALMLVPGSHKTFVACRGETPKDNHKTSLQKQEVGVPGRDTIARMVAENGLDAATGPAGTVVFFDCNTLHGSNGNITPDPRSNAFFVFNAVSNALVAPFAADDPRPGHLANRDGARTIVPQGGRLTGA
ncbi:ectoine hydroxylase [Lutimaribacter pacificus]|uniref:Ectoine hydroxylase n=1 Tax=Lutimaribacter pacificus TaxID=391948 RepID=A0A1H0JJ89_9RHOB|nr:ectoine hydroxylase [Lutimaribacter pacificus]SDO43848.1 ectoine hydroxylase [Lutimaribacter pacificus]SHK09426.1 ectoine hydroxylase [Lutimaribacter pacificus]